MDPVERLFVALSLKDVAEVRRLVAQDPSLRHARGPWGLPPLHHALYLRASGVVETLLAAGVEPTVFEAAAMGDVARVLALVERDPSLRTAQGPDGAPALHLAAHFGHVEVVRALLRLGAPADLLSGGAFRNTPLHAAAAGGWTDVVETLLAEGAGVDARDGNGCTPLHVAAAGGSVDLCRALLAQGASPAAKAQDGRTPRDVAVERERREAAALLGA